MATLKYPKDRILFLMSSIYFIAFASLYIQLPGLYSRNGLTPVENIKLSDAPKSFPEFLSEPNLMRFAKIWRIDNYDAMELLVIIGALFSLLSIIFSSFRVMSTYIILWACYLSVYKVGQVFLWFQWDNLLLEAGFLTILLAPAGILNISLSNYVASDRIAIWMFKWLLFRLMFASGVVKLDSKCPTWWSLSALNYHFESQCIPTPLAFYAHQFPEWLLKLGVVATFMIEIIVPFLFFVPLKMIRLFSFYSQVLLQIAITISGNYNFFNLLTICLCYSLLNDDDFENKNTKLVKIPKNKKDKKKARQAAENAEEESMLIKASSWFMGFMIIVAVFALTVMLFKIEVNDSKIISRVGFTEEEFRTVLRFSVVYSIYGAIALFALQLLTSLLSVVTTYGNSGILSKLWNFFGVVIIGSIAIGIFFSSLVPFAHLERSALQTLPKGVKEFHGQLRSLELTHSYGLFRRMTGVGGRPEVILEGAMTKNGPWTKFDFHHKLGDRYRKPSIVAPHQPRLDWQMWFAALGDPNDDPWLYTLVYRILNNDKEVLQLIESTNMSQVPKFIRAGLYEFTYTKGYTGKAWWVRSRKREYLPPLSLSDPKLRTIMDQLKITSGIKSAPSLPSPLMKWKQQLREKVGQPKDLFQILGGVLLVLVTKKMCDSFMQ